MAGRVSPVRNWSEAPPPVDTWSMDSATSACLMAMTGVGRHHLDHQGRLQRVGDHHVGGQLEGDAPGGGSRHDLAGGCHHLLLDQRPADPMAFREQEGVGHAAADQQGLDPTHQGLEGSGLCGDLGTTDHRHVRLDRVHHHPLQRRHLPFYQESGGLPARSVEGGHGVDRRVTTVCGSKGVVDVVAEPSGQPPGEVRVVGLLTGVKAEVLQQQRTGLGRGDALVETVGHEAHRPAEGPLQRLGHRRQRVLRIGRPLGLSQMGAGGDHRRPVEQPCQGRQGGSDPGFILDHAVGDRHVEIESEQHPGVAQIAEVAEGRQVHARSRPTMNSSRSTHRTA